MDPMNAASMPNGGTFRRRALGAGPLSLVYLLKLGIALVLVPSALALFGLALYGLLHNASNRWNTWDWWRIAGTIFGVYLPGAIVYFLYQERKVNFERNADGSGGYNRALMRVIYALYQVGLIVMAVWFGMLTIWIGIGDIDRCADSTVCLGPFPPQPPANCTTSCDPPAPTPDSSLIMVMVCNGVLCLCCMVCFVLALYVHAAARDAWSLQVSNGGAFPRSMPFSQEIGGFFGDVATVLAAFQGNDDSNSSTDQAALVSGNSSSLNTTTTSATAYHCSTPQVAHYNQQTQTVDSVLL